MNIILKGLFRVGALILSGLVLILALAIPAVADDPGDQGNHYAYGHDDPPGLGHHYGQDKDHNSPDPTPTPVADPAPTPPPDPAPTLSPDPAPTPASNTVPISDPTLTPTPCPCTCPRTSHPVEAVDGSYGHYHVDLFGTIGDYDWVEAYDGYMNNPYLGALYGITLSEAVQLRGFSEGIEYTLSIPSGTVITYYGLKTLNLSIAMTESGLYISPASQFSNPVTLTVGKTEIIFTKIENGKWR